MNAFRELENEAKINLEDNQITELFHTVEEGNFEKAEAIMEKFIDSKSPLMHSCVKIFMIFHPYIDGDTEEYIANQKYKAKFSEVMPNSQVKPSNRIDAGYAFDSDSQIVYMFGGHSDETSLDLNDFWQFNLRTQCWSIIHEESSIVSPRCGQKMVYDPISKQIFMLGRRASRGIESLKVNLEIILRKILIFSILQNDFYLYDTQTKTWLLIFDDVSQMNGPSLLCDHQMCLNPKDRKIYIFGGKVLK